MKQIIIVTGHYKLDGIVQALRAEGVTAVTVSEVVIHGKDEIHDPRHKIEIVVPDDQEGTVVETATKEIRKPRNCGGDIFVKWVERAIRIRNEEEGEETVQGA